MFPSYRALQTSLPAEGIACITLARPEAANALNMDLAQELKDAFDKMLPAVRAVIITGSGKHFCAGADLKERKGMDETAWHRQHDAFETALEAIAICPVPVIAAVQGAAMGGGLELALVCDFIYATPQARFALTEASLGIMPGLGGTQRLPRAIGVAHAKEYLFTAKPFSGEDAYRLGMINKLVAPEALLNETLACAQAIAANAPLSVRAIKKAVNEGATLPVDEALECELRHYNSLLSTRDRHEGINAFNEKRKPSFNGN